MGASEERSNRNTHSTRKEGFVTESSHCSKHLMKIITVGQRENERLQ